MMSWIVAFGYILLSGFFVWNGVGTLLRDSGAHAWIALNFGAATFTGVGAVVFAILAGARKIVNAR